MQTDRYAVQQWNPDLGAWKTKQGFPTLEEAQAHEKGMDAPKGYETLIRERCLRCEYWLPEVGAARCSYCGGEVAR